MVAPAVLGMAALGGAGHGQSEEYVALLPIAGCVGQAQSVSGGAVGLVVGAMA